MRALYIEDEPLARWTGKQIIEGMGLEVMVAETCAQARELWEKNPFDVVISDYRLPDGTACGFIGEMRAAGRNEPVICLSGEVEDISKEQIESLALAAVLGKPLDAAGLEGVISSLYEESAEPEDSVGAVEPDGSEAHSNGAAATVPAGKIPPFWISPFWSLNSFGAGAWRDIEIAAGQGSDVWILLANCSDAGRKGPGIWKKLASAFVQIARWAPDAALPAETLNRCKQALIRDIAHDFTIPMLLLCLRNSRVLFAGDSAGRWNVFYEKVGEGWRMLNTSEDLTGEKESGAVLIADEEFPGQRHAEEVGDLDSVISGACKENSSGSNLFLLKPEDTCRSFRFSFGADHAEPGLLLEERLARMETALLCAGHNPFHARRFACALLGIIDSGSGSVRIRWDADTLWAEPAAGTNVAPESELFFDSVDRSEAAFRLGVEAFSDVPEMSSRTVSANEPVSGSDEKTGLFHVVKAPPVLVKSSVEEIRKRYIENKWVALDAGCVRCVSPQAMACLYMMANERRGSDGGERRTGAGGFCMAGMSALNEVIFRYWGMDSHIDLVDDIRGLDSLSRRLTSTSERSALLRS